ncbi:MAG: DUF86 domain-containing protein [Candidatus Wallbacteria bacterium]|nr:DUF86 domain-containing protein [Candidatus Wallbacteria bacterium]
MSRDYKVFLDDILSSIAKIRKFAGQTTFEQFSVDDKTVDAVLRNLEIIGEAAKGIPPEVREAAKTVDWKRLAGLRDVLAHQYFGINLAIVWDIVQHKLPALELEVQRLLATE